MAKKREFEIAFVGLKPGKHEFEYEVDNKFFIEKGASELNDTTAKLKLTLEKSMGFMQLRFEVGGSTAVNCDRCGNPLRLDLWDEFKVLVKLVENPEEMNNQEEDPDVFYISRNESHIDVSDWIYEFVTLSIPMQRMCSPDEVGGPQCNNEVLEKLKEMEARHVEHNATTLWKGLEKFKDN